MLAKFFFLFISTIILSDLFIYKMVVLQLTQKRIRFLYFLPSAIILSGLFFLKFSNGTFITVHDISAGWFLFFTFLLTIPKAIFFVFSIIDIAIKFVLRWSISGFDILSLVIPVAYIAIMLYGAIGGKTKFEIKEITYASAKVPDSFEGYRILQLSDFHIGSMKGNEKAIKQIVEMVNKQHPDLIVFTGDLINSRSEEIEEFKDILTLLHAKDGVYSVLGNHDYCYYHHWQGEWEEAADFENLKEKQTRMGWHLLNNEHIYLHRRNDSIALIGVENWETKHFKGKGDLVKAMKGIEYDNFKILLSHNPMHWHAEVLPISNIDLTLAGHTHASQFKIGNISPAACIYKEWYGMYTEGTQSMYVNPGIGYVGIPFRFGAWPEITVITLKKKQS